MWWGYMTKITKITSESVFFLTEVATSLQKVGFFVTIDVFITEK